MKNNRWQVWKVKSRRVDSSGMALKPPTAGKKASEEEKTGPTMGRKEKCKKIRGK